MTLRGNSQALVLPPLKNTRPLGVLETHGFPTGFALPSSTETSRFPTLPIRRVIPHIVRHDLNDEEFKTHYSVSPRTHVCGRKVRFAPKSWLNFVGSKLRVTSLMSLNLVYIENFDASFRSVRAYVYLQSNQVLRIVAINTHFVIICLLR